MTCTHDTLEFEIARRIRRRRTARTVALTHERYCGDTGQMYGATEDVAKVIRGVRFRHFWWD